MKVKKLVSVLLVLTLIMGTLQSVFGYVANAVDYNSSVLNYMIQNPGNFREDRYTEESYAFYATTLAAVTAVNQNPSATADEINAAVADLAAAEAALTYRATAYSSALNWRAPNAAILGETVQVKFKDAMGYELSNITATGVYANVGAFTLGEDGFYTADVTITGATGDLAVITVNYELNERTYTSYMYILCVTLGTSTVDKSALGASLAREMAMNRQKDDYSGGYQTYLNVIESSANVYINSTSTQMRTDRAFENISIAVNTLVAAYADYSEVYKLVAQANELNPDNYESFTAVTNAIALIEYDLPVTRQSYVNSMAENLQNALDSLTLKISRYTVKCVTSDGVLLGTKTYDGTRTYVVRVTAPVYPGYESTVQYQSISLTEDEHEVTFTYEPVIYYAYFDANGGQVDVASKQLTYDVEYGDLPVATRAGYEFLGWFSHPEGGEQIFSETIVTINYVETLYAHWSDVEVYTFAFDSATGSACEDLVSAYGEEITLPTPVKYGYTFLGWYYADGTKAEHATMPDLGSDGDVVTLTAKWTEAVYDVTLDAGEFGTVSAAAHTVTYGSAYGVMPVAVREGHTFLGWFTEPEGGVQVTAATLVELDTAHTLYAHYEVNEYTLYFDMGGGEEIVPIVQDYGTPIVLEKEPYKEFYIFEGWSLNGEEFELKTMPAGNVTIQAVWTLNAKTTYYLDAYKTVDGVRVPARTVAPGDVIDVEVSIQTNYPAGQAYFGILFDKRVFDLGATTMTKMCTPNTTSDYMKSLKTTTISGSATFATTNWGPIIEGDPLINTTDFRCIRPQTQAFNEAKVPVVLSEKTLVFTASFKVKSSIDSSLLSGLITIDERLCKTPENSTNKYPTFVTNQKYDAELGTYATEDTVNLVPNCENACLDIMISDVTSELGAAAGSTTVVDYSNEFVYGLAEDLTMASFAADYATVIGTGTIACDDAVLKTGSVIKVMNGDKCMAEYTVVIYGDVNSNAKADGEDAFVVNMVAMGAIDGSALTAAQREAADANHDGVIDFADVDLLSNSGLFKETVSQK